MKCEDASIVIDIFNERFDRLQDKYEYDEEFELYLNIFLEEGRVLKTGECFVKSGTKLVVDAFNNQYIDSQKIVSIQIIETIFNK